MNWEEAYRKYNHNVIRHLSHIHKFIHQETNKRLVKLGYKNFEMSFIEVIPYLDPNGVRLVDLVDQHLIHKATLSRLINRIHHQGFIEKHPDPKDSRAKVLFITDSGIKLIENSLQITVEIAEELNLKMGKVAFKEFSSGVRSCFKALNLEYPSASYYVSKKKQKNSNSQLLIQLNGIVGYVETDLLQNNIRKGFGDIENGHRAVLAHISEQGTRPGLIAEREGLSKQNISDISHALIERKYIKQIADPEDKRAQRLVFAAKGKAMITAAMIKLIGIEKEIRNNMDVNSYQNFISHSERLWFLLGGQCPDPVGSGNLNELDSAVQHLLNSLKDTVLEKETHLLGEIFCKEDGTYRLSGRFLEYLKEVRLS